MSIHPSKAVRGLCAVILILSVPQHSYAQDALIPPSLPGHKEPDHAVALLTVKADWTDVEQVKLDVDEIRAAIKPFASADQLKDPWQHLHNMMLGDGTHPVEFSSEYFVDVINWLRSHGVVWNIRQFNWRPQGAIHHTSADEVPLKRIHKLELSHAGDQSFEWLVHFGDRVVRSLRGKNPSDGSQRGLDGQFIVDQAAASVKKSSDGAVLIVPFFGWKRDAETRAERRAAGARDYLVIWSRSQTDVTNWLRRTPPETLERGKFRKPDNVPEWNQFPPVRFDKSVAANDTDTVRKKPADIPSDRKVVQPFVMIDDKPRGQSDLSGINGRMFKGGEGMLWWSENNDLLRGFSQVFGKWTPLKIQPQEEITPVTSRRKIAVRLTDSVAVFDISSGTWHVLPLSKGSTAVLSATETGFEIEDNGKYYTFGSRWTSPNDPDFEETYIQYQTKHIKPSTLLPLLKPWSESLRQSGVIINWQTSGQGVGILAARKSWAKIAVAKLKELDVAHSPNASRSPSGRHFPTDPGVARRSPRAVPPIERSSLELAQSLRNTGDVTKAQRTELKNLVAKSLDDRLNEQEAQARQLKEKLAKVERALKQRREARERIIERRVEELLDPNVNWESVAPAAAARTMPYGMPQTGTPIGLPGPPHIPVGGPAGQPTHQTGSARSISGNYSYPEPVQSSHANPNSARPEVTRSASGAEIVRELINRRRFAELSTKPIRNMQRRLVFLGNEVVLKGDEPEHLDRVRSAEDEMIREQEELRNAMAEWKTSWRNYEGQLRLAENSLENSERLLRFAEAALEQSREFAERGFRSSDEFRAAEKEAELAKFEVLQMKERMQILASIEEDSPHLNPVNFDLTDLLSKPDAAAATPARVDQSAVDPTSDVQKGIRLLIANRDFEREGDSDSLRVSFDDVDLRKVLNMERVPPDAEKHFPNWLRNLNGKRIRIRGFMYPGFMATGIKQFVLVRDRGLGSSGPEANVHERIEVRMAEGTMADYVDGKTIDVEGIFRIEPETEGGHVLRLFKVVDAAILK